MGKVLLVDTNFSSAPIYEVLLKMGHEVHVVGGNPLDCMAKKSNHYWNIDYSDVAELKKLISQEAFDFIVPGCTDRSFQSCVEIGYGKYPGFDSPKVNDTINNKELFRETAERLGLPAPRCQRGDFDTLRWPLIVKPVDAFSGKGITVIKSESRIELQSAIENAIAASSSGKYIIEDYVEGQLYSHSAFLKSGRVVADFVVQEDSSANPYAVDTSRVVSDFCVESLAILRESSETLAVALSLQDGLLHTQFIANASGVWLIELTRRCPGDLYSQLIELSTGCHYVKAYVSPFLGMDFGVDDEFKNNDLIMRHTVTVKDSQIFGHVRFKFPLQIERWIPLSLTGDTLRPSPLGRVGILFCRFKDDASLSKLYDITLRRELYDISV